MFVSSCGIPQVISKCRELLRDGCTSLSLFLFLSFSLLIWTIGNKQNSRTKIEIFISCDIGPDFSYNFTSFSISPPPLSSFPGFLLTVVSLHNIIHRHIIFINFFCLWSGSMETKNEHNRDSTNFHKKNFNSLININIYTLLLFIIINFFLLMYP